MNKRDLDYFKKVLMQERERLIKGVSTLRESAFGELDGSSDMLDPEEPALQGTDSNQRDTAITLAAREQEMLIEIDDALKRIEDGTYGICEGTEKLIPLARLKVFPTARYCVEYQAKLEQEAGMGGGY